MALQEGTCKRPASSVEDMSTKRALLLEHMKNCGRKELTELSAREEDATEVFAAWMSFMRDSKQEPQPRDPIYCRFPEQYVSRCHDFPECQTAVADILDRGKVDLSASKLWQLFVFIWFGCGGYYLQPWLMCRKWPQVKTYKEGDVTQPIAIMILFRKLVEQRGTIREVTGADGRDKWSRLKNERNLVDWHSAVVSLIAAWKTSEDDFENKLRQLPGFGGDLTPKEFFVLLSLSSFPKLKQFGNARMTYGSWARVAGRCFLGGVLPTHSRHEKIKEIKKHMTKHLVLSQCSDVSVGDVEVSLCTIEHYIKHIAELQSKKKPSASEALSRTQTSRRRP